MRSRPWRLAIAAAAVVACATVGLFRASRSRVDRLASAAAATNARFVEGRLHGFDHAPRLRPRGSGASTPETLQLRSVASSVAADTTEARDRESLHERGIALLAMGDVASAVATLERAAAISRDSPAAWSDLSAARLELALATNDTRDTSRAIAAADAALAIEPGNPAALFNRARAIEALGLTDAAAEAYERFIRADGGSSWVPEAQERLAALTRQHEASWKQQETLLRRSALAGDLAATERLVRAFPQQARTYSELLYLSRWGSALSGGRAAEARDELAIVRAIAGALRKTSGETLLAEAVVAIDKADADAIRALARAHPVYERARRLYRDRQAEAATPEFIACGRDFAAGGSPMARMARYFEGAAAFDSGHIADGEAILRGLLADLPPGHQALRAQIHWQLGTIVSARGALFDGLDGYLRASEIFERLGEGDNHLNTLSAAARTLTLLGRSAEARRVRAKAFRAAAAIQDQSRLQVLLSSAGRDEMTNGDPLGARTLFTLALDVRASSESKPNPRLHVDLLQSRARAAWELHDAEAAANDLARARVSAAALGDATMTRSALAAIGLAEAKMLRATDPARAVDVLTGVIEDGATRPVGAEELYLERARARRQIGDQDHAIEDLSAAVEQIERRGIAVPLSERESYFAAMRNTYRELAEALHDAARDREAFAVADRGRALLLDPTAPKGLDLEEIQKALPPDALLLHYTTWSRGIGVFAIRSNSFSAARIDTAGLDQLVRAMSARDRAAIRNAATVLGSRLLGPAARQLTSGGILVVVPDDTTAAVPFSALRNPATGRLVVEERETVVMPSAAYLVRRGRSQLGGSRQAALIVGDPAFDPRRFPDLRRLPAAEAEAGQIARFYRAPTLLTGESATARALREGLASCDVLHIGSHAIAHPSDATLSALVLAPSGDDSGVVTTSDLGRHGARRLQVAVLAGCHTGGGAQSSRTSLAFGFLAAGSAGVAGTLWDIDDDASRAFSIELHRQLVAGATVSSAVRAAQLAMLRDRSDDGEAHLTWSSFQAYGAID